LFAKILIANRGEIAVRIIRTCRSMGIGTVAVYSDVDARSLHVEASDEAIYLGPPPAAESYLSKEKIIEAALSTGCEAIHPGYGFLSENQDFAQLVSDAGLLFIGPPPVAIARLGDKIAAKELARKAGVPVVPGHHEALSHADEAVAIAERLGFPVLLKPAAGGGGRGMRVVSDREEMVTAFSESRDESGKSFADNRIFMEHYIVCPRHIEIQIIADRYGNTLHLGESECSIQRRHQKLIEESPSVAVSAALRNQMGSVACALAREVGYVSAGTVEFILDQDNNFYFLEMNTRLQVEHPVTEMVTSLDLVALQLQVAAGERLPVSQEQIEPVGWAIEARVCAEDPQRDFFPTIGMITRYAIPKGKNVRVDSGIGPGSVVTIYYDSLLAKVIAYGQDREQARHALVHSLNGFHLEGLITNVDFLNAVVEHPAFIAGDLSTDFIEEHFQDGKAKIEPSLKKLHYMAIAAVLIHHVRKSLVRESLRPMAATVGGKPTPQAVTHYVLSADEHVFNISLQGDQIRRSWKILIERYPYEVETPEFEFFRRRLKLTIDGESQMFRVRYQEHHIQMFFSGLVRTFQIYSPREWELSRYMPREKEAIVENVLKCPMPGLVTHIRINPGQFVRKGQEVLRIESMKMESGIVSPCDGQVEAVMVSSGQPVDTDEILLKFAMNAVADSEA